MFRPWQSSMNKLLRTSSSPMYKYLLVVELTNNCEMDALAKQYRRNLLQVQPKTTQHPKSPCTQKVGASGMVRRNSTRPLLTPFTTTFHKPRLLKYWTSTNSLQDTPRIPPPNAIDQVDWESTGILMNALTAGCHCWYTKHGSENCGGVGKTAKAWE
jgi:hypothetical protein